MGKYKQNLVTDRTDNHVYLFVVSRIVVRVRLVLRSSPYVMYRSQIRVSRREGEGESSSSGGAGQGRLMSNAAPLSPNSALVFQLIKVLLHQRMLLLKEREERYIYV